MSEFIGTMILVGAIAVGAYWVGKGSMSSELRYWTQRAYNAERIADDMGRAAMENYIDVAVAELRQGR
jgi:hypothetical protein